MKHLELFESPVDGTATSFRNPLRSRVTFPFRSAALEQKFKNRRSKKSKISFVFWFQEERGSLMVWSPFLEIS